MLTYTHTILFNLFHTSGTTLVHLRYVPKVLTASAKRQSGVTPARVRLVSFQTLGRPGPIVVDCLVVHLIDIQPACC
jgi:hypothetical protein